MLRITFILVLIQLVTPHPVIAQVQSPVIWTYESTKLNRFEFEVRITATIKSGWHIYSQASPDEGGLPTKVTFEKNEHYTLNGKLVEDGNLIVKYEEAFETEVKIFEKKVIYTQRIKLGKKQTDLIKGTIEFMACKVTLCLPPETVEFSISLDKKYNQTNPTTTNPALRN